MRLVRLSIAAVTILVAAVSPGSSPRAAFVASFHSPSGTLLLTGVGEVYRVEANSTLKLAFVFTNRERSNPYHWTAVPNSFVRWQTDWIVSDTSNRLVRFHSDGSFSGLTEVPIRVGSLVVTKEAVWALDVLASSTSDQLWRSTDGKTFKAMPQLTPTRRFHSAAENIMIVAGGRGDELYSAFVIGPPTVHLSSPGKRQVDIPVAYSRSKFRAGLEEIIGLIDDVTPYSLPVRDLYPLQDGRLLVLRNREDVRSPSGTVELMLGRRADQYDSTGHHIATAVFSMSVNWLVGVTPQTVTGVSRSGEIATGTWGKALPAEILTP